MHHPPIRKTESWYRLTAVVVAVLIIEGISSAITIPVVQTWYPALAKPAWNPPNWLFGPVWIALYCMIAWAGWRLWEKARLRCAAAWQHAAVAWFILQLVTNFAWSLLFFGMHMPMAALADIALLDISVFACLCCAWRMDRTAAWLLVPYLLWVLYATSLNGAIVWLNR